MMAETTEELLSGPKFAKSSIGQQVKNIEKALKLRAPTSSGLWCTLVFLQSAALFISLAGAKLIPLSDHGIAIAQRILRGVAFITIVLAVARALSVYGLARIEDSSTRFTLQRIMRLAIGLAVALIVVSVIFVNWYTAVAAFGVGSIILGLAVQTPMKSFIAWIYILVRQPFRVGDRIKIAGATGDVIDVGYLDTTLWEFGGQYLSTDHPSGRLIKFPNEKVLQELVYNYSWPLFPYIWNEVKFQVAFNADLEFIANTDAKNHRGRTWRGNDRTRTNFSRPACPYASGRIGSA
jgi:small-conductance mechanosensitive channel